MTAMGLHTRRMDGRGGSLLGRLWAVPLVVVLLLALGVASQHGHVDEDSSDGTRVCTVCHFASETAHEATGTVVFSPPAPIALAELPTAPLHPPSGEVRLATARAPPLDI